MLTGSQSLPIIDTARSIPGRAYDHTGRVNFDKRALAQYHLEQVKQHEQQTERAKQEDETRSRRHQRLLVNEQQVQKEMIQKKKLQGKELADVLRNQQAERIQAKQDERNRRIRGESGDEAAASFWVTRFQKEEEEVLRAEKRASQEHMRQLLQAQEAEKKNMTQQLQRSTMSEPLLGGGGLRLPSIVQEQQEEELSRTRREKLRSESERLQGNGKAPANSKAIVIDAAFERVVAEFKTREREAKGQERQARRDERRATKRTERASKKKHDQHVQQSQYHKQQMQWREAKMDEERKEEQRETHTLDTLSMAEEEESQRLEKEALKAALQEQIRAKEEADKAKHEAEVAQEREHNERSTQNMQGEIVLKHMKKAHSKTMLEGNWSRQVHLRSLRQESERAAGPGLTMNTKVY